MEYAIFLFSTSTQHISAVFYSECILNIIFYNENGKYNKKNFISIFNLHFIDHKMIPLAKLKDSYLEIQTNTLVSFFSFYTGIFFFFPLIFLGNFFLYVRKIIVIKGKD